MHILHSFGWAQGFELERGRWEFPLKHQKAPFCGRKLSLKPQLGIFLFGISGMDTHYGTPFLRPSAYKARVEGVSPRCGIEQNLKD